MKLIPVTVLTGFLGAGKTTLLNRLLKHPEMAGSAVLINEFGEIGLDHLLVEKLDEDTVLLNAGCLCCTIRGDLQRAQAEEARLQALAGIPFVTPSIAVLEGLKAIGNPKRIGVLTPYWPPADAIIAEFFTACGFEVVASHGLKSTGPISVAQFTTEQIMQGFEALDKPQVQALVHVGTNLPVSAMTPAIEAHFGKPLIGVNVATYWLALRRLGLRDAMPGFGILAEQH